MTLAKWGRDRTLLRAFLLIVVGSLTAACASRDGIVANTTETHGKGAILAAIVYETDHDVIEGGFTLRRSYQFKLDIVKEVDGLPTATEEKNYQTEIYKKVTGENLKVWVVLEALPRVAYLASISEKVFDTDEDDYMMRKTIFYQAPPTGGNDPFTDQVPKFSINDGEVVYIGTFKIRIKSGWRGLFRGWQTISEAVKGYSFDPSDAETVVRESYLKKLPIRSVNLFEGRTRALEKLGVPWTQRGQAGDNAMQPPPVGLTSIAGAER